MRNGTAGSPGRVIEERFPQLEQVGADVEVSRRSRARPASRRKSCDNRNASRSPLRPTFWPVMPTGNAPLRSPDRRALAAILGEFIAEELRPSRTFPPELYGDIFRLKGWPGTDGVKWPSVIGTYTNDIVYDRLAPGVLDRLKRIIPPVSPGRRRHKRFQWLTGGVGHPS